MSPDVSPAESSRYTHGHEAVTVDAHATRTAANSCAYLLPHLRPGMTLLDVGCGPASITLDLAALLRDETHPDTRVVGLENAEAALTIAREAAARRGDATTEFLPGDAMALPFEDDSFDVVHAHQVLQHLPDPALALREMRRVCRPEGIVAVRDADYASFAWYPASPGLESWLETYRAIARRNGGEPDAGRHFRRWAREAGLAPARITTGVWTYAEPESCRWWGTTQSARVDAPLQRDQAVALGATHEDVDAMVRGWREWMVEPDAWFIVPNAEMLVLPTH